MEKTALGAIETFGLIPAIEAADAAVKSADVSLSRWQYTGAGLVTVLISGDISAVRASVDAGKAAARKLGTVISTTVIGKTARGLKTILREDSQLKYPCRNGNGGAGLLPTGEKSGQVMAPLGLKQDGTLGSPGSELDRDVRPLSEQMLRKTTVIQLRRIARSLGSPFSIGKKDIKFARKKDLIRAIIDYYR